MPVELDSSIAVSGIALEPLASFEFDGQEAEFQRDGGVVAVRHGEVVHPVTPVGARASDVSLARACRCADLRSWVRYRTKEASRP